jgi:hypothetical protein
LGSRRTRWFGWTERPFVLIPVGLPAAEPMVPAIAKKDLTDVFEIK